jgi:hypothetical protein
MTTSTIWQKPIDLATIAATGAGTAVEHLGIEVHTILDDGLVARMPVDARTRQPMGLLHGGVSVVLAETLGSLGAYFASPTRPRDGGAGHQRQPLARGALWLGHGHGQTGSPGADHARVGH